MDSVWLNPHGQLAQVPWAALPGAHRQAHQLKSLPGTAREQAQIASLARKVLKTEPVVLQDAAAGIAQVSAELPKGRAPPRPPRRRRRRRRCPPSPAPAARRPGPSPQPRRC